MQQPHEVDTPGHGNERRRTPLRTASQPGGLGRLWASFSGKLRRIVDSKYFNRGIMAAILVNTLSMGVEYHEQVCVCACARVCRPLPPTPMASRACRMMTPALEAERRVLVSPEFSAFS